MHAVQWHGRVVFAYEARVHGGTFTAMGCLISRHAEQQPLTGLLPSSISR